MSLTIIFVKDYSIIMSKLMEKVYLQTQTRTETKYDLNVILIGIKIKSEELNRHME